MSKIALKDFNSENVDVYETGPGHAKGFQPFPAGDKKEPSFPQKDIFVDCLFSGDATKASNTTKGASTLMYGGILQRERHSKKFQDPLKLKRCKKT